MQQTIRIHAAAPDKPARGDACNGCGVCCAAEPCPIGMLISRRRRGPCAAVVWDDDRQRYLCGLVAAPMRFLGPRVGRLALMIVEPLIAAGRGCDSDARVID